MTNEEWTVYSTRLVLSAHNNGVAEGLRRAAKTVMEWSFQPISQDTSVHDLAKKLLDSSFEVTR